MEISKLYNRAKQITNQGWFAVLVLGVLCLFCLLGCAKDSNPTNPLLAQAEACFLLDDFVVGDSILYNIDTVTLSSADKYIWQMLAEHSSTHMYRSLTTDFLLQQLINYFEEKKIYHYAGYGYYLQGWRCVTRNQEEEAMLCYKKAEEYALYDVHRSANLLANLYGNMARCSKIEGLLNQTVYYCEQAIDYGHVAHNYFIVSESYKLIANANRERVVEGKEIPIPDIVNQYDSALNYYSLTSNKKVGNYYIIQYNKADLLRDSAAMFYYSKLLVDSFSYRISALALTEHYVERQMIDSARYYLEIFAPDTITSRRNTRWSHDQYDFFEASCLYLEGDYKQAAELFKKQYQDLNRSLAETENTRTYAVSRKYDVEKEKREKLELELEKKGLTISLIIAGACVIIFVLLFLVYREYSRRKHESMQKNQEILEKELSLKRESMRQNLLMRIELTRDLYLSNMRKETSTDVQEQWPVWLVQLVHEQTFAEPQKMEQLFEDFNSLYHNMLGALSKQYPRLTKADLLMVVFIVLQLPINDICVLMNASKQVVWNRKNRIRNHMELPATISIDEYLIVYARQLK